MAQVKGQVEGPPKVAPKKTKKNLVIRPSAASAVMPMIKARADVDHDGVVTKADIQEYFSHADFNESLVQQYKKLFIIQTVAAALIIIVLATVTGIAVQFSKESHVMGNIFVNLEGNAVQCVSKELDVASDGVLKLKDQENTVVRTLKVPSVSHPLNSKVPDK